MGSFSSGPRGPDVYKRQGGDDSGIGVLPVHSHQGREVRLTCQHIAEGHQEGLIADPLLRGQRGRAGSVPLPRLAGDADIDPVSIRALSPCLHLLGQIHGHEQGFVDAGDGEATEHVVQKRLSRCR